MFWLILGSTIPSMPVCFAAAFAVRRWGPRFGLVDRPGHRKIHAVPMPTGGGLAIWLGIVLPLAVGQVALWGLAGRWTVRAHHPLPLSRKRAEWSLSAARRSLGRMFPACCTNR